MYNSMAKMGIVHRSPGLVVTNSVMNTYRQKVHYHRPSGSLMKVAVESPKHVNYCKNLGLYSAYLVMET